MRGGKNSLGESAACHLRDSEAVFQHLKPDNLTIGDGEVRRDDIAASLEFRRERTKYRCSFVAGQNVVNLKGDSIDHGPRITNEICDGGSSGFVADPW